MTHPIQHLPTAEQTAIFLCLVCRKSFDHTFNERYVVNFAPFGFIHLN